MCFMANPKKRRTHGASAKTRSHAALEKLVLNKCPKCGRALRPHRACPFCGYYRGREVVKIKSTKKNKKKKE